MRKRLATTALLLTIFIAIEIVIAPNMYAERMASLDKQEHVLVVDKIGGEYQTIQDAISNAPEGSTIYVKTGAYNEIINIKKRINLIGEDKDKTIIRVISEKNKYAIRLGSAGVTIKCLSITNRGPGQYTTGVQIAAAQTSIQDCNIYDTPVGVAVWTSNNIISGCNFWGCEDEGIALMGTSYSECNNNKITNCIFHDNCDGIELQYSSGNTIENCEFYDNTHTGIDAISSSNDNNIISNCKIYNNDVHGIYLCSSSNNQITDCQMSNNKDGNVIATRNSHNNEVEYSDYNQDAEKKNIIDRLLDRIKQLQSRSSRIKIILSSIYQNLHF